MGERGASEGADGTFFNNVEIVRALLGLDDHGNVANLVESEQIIFYKGFISSYVQVRGTPPVFFS